MKELSYPWIEACLEPYQTSMMHFFAKLVNLLKA